MIDATGSRQAAYITFFAVKDPSKRNPWHQTNMSFSRPLKLRRDPEACRMIHPSSTPLCLQVADVGLAKFMTNEHFVQVTTIGKLAWAAPELLRLPPTPSSQPPLLANMHTRPVQQATFHLQGGRAPGRDGPDGHAWNCHHHRSGAVKWSTGSSSAGQCLLRMMNSGKPCHALGLSAVPLQKVFLRCSRQHEICVCCA